jgi:Domain of unknown function (DUF1924)
MRRRIVICWVGLLAGLLGSSAALAGAHEELLERYAAQARNDDPAFGGFSAERGEAFYHEPHVIKGAGVWSCSSCHLKDPRYSVKAHRTDIPCRACHVINDWEHPNPKKAKLRRIDPFAPSANVKRLNDPKQVEVFLKLNCLLLLKRECTAQEKGDVITYLLGLEGSAKGDLLNVGKHQIGGIEEND